MHFTEQNFESYLTEHSGRMYAYIQNRTRDWAQSDDLLQDLFLKVYHYCKKHGEFPSLPYLYRMAHNLIIDHVRKQDRRVQTSNLETTPSVEFQPTPYQEHESELQCESFWEQFAPLGFSTQEKYLFWFVERHGYTIREAAEKVGLPKSTAHDKHQSMMKRLRAFLSDDAA